MYQKNAEKLILEPKSVPKGGLGTVGALKMRVLGLKTELFVKTDVPKSLHFYVVFRNVASEKCLIYVYLKHAKQKHCIFTVSAKGALGNPCIFKRFARSAKRHSCIITLVLKHVNREFAVLRAFLEGYKYDTVCFTYVLLSENHDLCISTQCQGTPF